MNHSLVRRVKVAVSKNAAAALAVETAEAEVVAATVVETVAAAVTAETINHIVISCNKNPFG